MQVTIIGSGNVATVMGRLLALKGYFIREVYSRNAENALLLANQLGAKPVSDLAQIDRSADLYLIAVADDVLPGIAAQLSLHDKLVIHTAGSVSKEVLQNTSTNYGVLWPMKMIRKTMTTLEPVTIVVDGSSESVTRQLRQLAIQFSPIVTQADDITRVKMHLLAALTSNFTNHLYHLAVNYCQAENIDPASFYPLIEETAQRIKSIHPKQLQAGPAFRGDRQTIDKHLQLLEKYPDTRKVYQAMTESIAGYFGNNMPEKPGL
jgi:predicted short-subunit dehydrogenase-like oxidoreductase (DUF2520 family)